MLIDRLRGVLLIQLGIAERRTWLPNTVLILSKLSRIGQHQLYSTTPGAYIFMCLLVALFTKI